jgi:hypothetical protein
MRVWLEKPRHRPDIRHKASARTIVRSAFQNLVEILSRFESHPDDVALSSERSYFSGTQFPYQGFAPLDHRNGRPDG